MSESRRQQRRRRLALFSAGSNAKGQLAHGTVDDSHSFLRCSFDNDAEDPLADGIKSMSLAFGANHTLLLLRSTDDESTLWVCGDGLKGQIGAENRELTAPLTKFRRIELEHPPGFVYSAIAACWETSFVALSHPEKADILLSMGADDFGDRGVGSLRSSEAPLSVTAVSFAHLLDEEERLSASLIIAEIKTGIHTALVKLVCSRSDDSSRTLFAGWGASRHAQLGRDSTSLFVASPIIVPVANPEDVASFAAGSHHSVFVYSSGIVCALGSNRKMQCHELDLIDKARSVDTTWSGTYIVLESSESARIYATGSNGRGQVASSPSKFHSSEFVLGKSSYVHKVICGSEHVLVWLKDASSNEHQDGQRDEIMGFGWNEHGNLGLGHTDDVHEPKLVWPDSGRLPSHHKLHGVWAGLGTTWIAIEYDT